MYWSNWQATCNLKGKSSQEVRKMVNIPDPSLEKED